MSRQTIGSRIRELRRKIGLSAAALGTKAGTHESYVIHVESGRLAPAVDMLKKLAKVLGVPVSYLLLKNSRVHADRIAEELESHGIATTEKVRKAMANPAFLRFAEACAKKARTRAGLARMEAALKTFTKRKRKKRPGRPRKKGRRASRSSCA